MRPYRVSHSLGSLHGELNEASNEHIDISKQQHEYVCFKLELSHTLDVYRRNIYVKYEDTLRFT